MARLPAFAAATLAAVLAAAAAALVQAHRAHRRHPPCRDDRTILRLFAEAGRPLALTIDHADLATLAGNLVAHHAAALKAAGCDLVAVPAIGAHLEAAGIARVGVLGTPAVMGSRLYGMAGAGVIAPEGAEAARVDADYTALARAGAAAAEQRERFVAAGAGLMARGAAAVLLSGTDLSLAFDGVEAGYPVIDGAVVHAEAITRVAMAW